MVFQIQLAGRVIEIHTLYELTYNRCKNYIISDKALIEPEIIVNISQNDLDDEEKRILTYQKNGSTKDVLVYTPEQIETRVIYRRITEELLQYNTILMHGSVIATKGNGFMFTAPSGVGKTTRTRLWIDNISDSIVVNGDKPLIKVSSESVYACGTPWGGKEGWNNNTIVPLRAVFLLERIEKGEQTSIAEVRLGEAFVALAHQTYQCGEPDALQKTLRLLREFDGKVKFYKFRSAPTLEAVRLAYETAK